MEDFVRFAIAKGFVSFGFSSHAPLPFLTKWTMKEDDFPEYYAEFLRLKQKYEKKIQLYLALEADYISGYSSIRNEFFQEKPFGYLVGSIHYVDKIPNGRFWNIFGSAEVFDEGLQAIFGGDIRAAVLRYFECEKEMLSLGGFQILGHCDKIVTPAQRFPEFDANASWYENAFADMLACAKNSGVIVEINTKALCRKGVSFPDQRWFPLLREMGIPVTLSSDCHNPDDVDSGFRVAFPLLRKAGFRSVRILLDGRWQDVPFGDGGLLL